MLTGRVTPSILAAVVMSVSTVVPAHTPQSRDCATEICKAYRTRTGKTVMVSETRPTARGLGTIEIRTRGFEYDFNGGA